MPADVPYEVGFDDCLAAARAVRNAELGRQAYDTVRPRGVSGLVRSRGPLCLLLYLAGREGRLRPGHGRPDGFVRARRMPCPD